MKFHIFTLFPNVFESPLAEGVVGRALKSGLIEIKINNIRDYSTNKHGSVDDYPFGGGPGMLLKPEPIFESLRSQVQDKTISDGSPLILLSPQGRKFNQKVAKELSQKEEISLICGRYEGFDERIRSNLATDEISIGDFVLTGGQKPAITIIDQYHVYFRVLSAASSPQKTIHFSMTYCNILNTRDRLNLRD